MWVEGNVRDQNCTTGRRESSTMHYDYNSMLYVIDEQRESSIYNYNYNFMSLIIDDIYIYVCVCAFA